MENIKKIGNTSFVTTQVGTYALQMDGFSMPVDRFMGADLTGWDQDPISVAGVRIVPWGPDNNLPNYVRRILERNNLAPGILDRKVGLVYGQGPMLYRVKVEGNERVQEWVEDADIQSWLDSWDYKRFIREALVEYNHMKGVFVRYHAGRGIRIGRPWIHSLDCLPSEDCRLVWPANEGRMLDDVKKIMVGDFDRFDSPRYRIYPVFDKWNPTAAGTAVKYHSLRSFSRNMYSISSFFGSIPWMEDANSLPDIIHYLNNNMIAAAYIVHTPGTYWEEKRRMIQEKFPSASEPEVQKKLEDYKDRLTRQIADVMSGSYNAGKFFICVDFYDLDGKPQSWKIEPIEMNI